MAAQRPTCVAGSVLVRPRLQYCGSEKLRLSQIQCQTSQLDGLFVPRRFGSCEPYSLPLSQPAHPAPHDMSWLGYTYHEKVGTSIHSFLYTRQKQQYTSDWEEIRYPAFSPFPFPTPHNRLKSYFPTANLRLYDPPPPQHWEIFLTPHPQKEKNDKF